MHRMLSSYQDLHLPPAGTSRMLQTASGSVPLFRYPVRFCICDRFQALPFFCIWHNTCKGGRVLGTSRGCNMYWIAEEAGCLSQQWRRQSAPACGIWGCSA